MTDKELRKLNRMELLEILVKQSKEIDELQAKLKAAEEKLEKKELIFKSVGSIAEASLELSGVFSAAQEAANHYVDSVKALSEHYEKLLEENYKKRDAELSARQAREKEKEEQRRFAVGNTAAQREEVSKDVDTQIMAHRGFGRINTQD